MLPDAVGDGRLTPAFVGDNDTEQEPVGEDGTELSDDDSAHGGFSAGRVSNRAYG